LLTGNDVRPHLYADFYYSVWLFPKEQGLALNLGLHSVQLCTVFVL